MRKIKEIFIGSNNIGKFKEIAELLPKNIKKFSPKDFDLKSPEETGKTFIENAEIKADYFSKKTNMITISDDSGLEIECLNNQPGILSARWAIEYGSFDNAMNEILKRIEKINKNKVKKNTKAKFISALTIKWPEGKKISELGKIEGSITSKKGNNGFGYDPIFVPKGYNMTFGEMNYKDKLLIDHRFIAYKKIEKKIINYF